VGFSGIGARVGSGLRGASVISKGTVGVIDAEIIVKKRERMRSLAMM